MRSAKKLVAIILTVAMLTTLGVSALADSEKDIDQRLEDVTLKVKATLGIGDEFSDFYGYLSSEGDSPRWQLEWSSDEDSLSVSAGEDGKICNLYRNASGDFDTDSGYSDVPAFPSVARETAQAAAEAFLAKVLSDGESVVLEESSKDAYDTENYYFCGTLKVSGVSTPFSVNLNVRCSDLEITSFNRGDGNSTIRGGYPSASPAVTASSAASAMRAIQSLDLRWVLAGEDKTATLVYVPELEGGWVVDAQTGKPVDLTDSWKGYLTGGSSAADSAESEENGAGLTEAELEGISKLEGALTTDQLDKAVRGETILGVTDAFDMTGASYSLDNETDELTVWMRYVRKIENPADYGIAQSDWDKSIADGGSPRVIKFFTLDGKTGEILSVYTYYVDINGNYEESDREAGAIPAAASQWLTSKYPHFADAALYSSDTGDYGAATDSYHYAQSVEGYFYYGNYIDVTVNAKLGCIDSFNAYWDEEITFGKSAPVAGVEIALDTYSDAFGYELAYVSDDYGYDDSWGSYCHLLLAWVPTLENSVIGVDAVSGELLAEGSDTEDMSIVYSDLRDNYAKSMILELAEYGVGYYGGSFSGEAKLSQLDLVLLLMSAHGHTYIKDDMTQDDIDYLYSCAEYLGYIAKGDRAPQRGVTRAELSKALVTMAGFAKAAELPGIYVCGFTDDADIPADCYGYVAIAKGMGVVSGYPSGEFRPSAVLTREEAAVMLWKFMDRAR